MIRPSSHIVAQVLAEQAKARAKYGPYASAHEALGVLEEERDELRAAIHANDGEAIASEALQVAAVALRLSHEIQHEEAMRERSGV